MTESEILARLPCRSPEDDNAQSLHRGIRARAFLRQFSLADYLEMTGARLDNGLLVIDLRSYAYASAWAARCRRRARVTRRNSVSSPSPLPTSATNQTRAFIHPTPAALPARRRAAAAICSCAASRVRADAR